MKGLARGRKNGGRGAGHFKTWEKKRRHVNDVQPRFVGRVWPNQRRRDGREKKPFIQEPDPTKRPADARGSKTNAGGKNDAGSRKKEQN